ncbi:hypothetical protein [Roseicitreum antarcticum]|nr:hypothetical protein [Roseicitreum antarcticum]
MQNVTSPGAAQRAQGTDPWLALNLAYVEDWSAQQPFIDVMKTARAWIGHLPGQWGGWDYDDLAHGGYLDAQGWPVALPPELEGIATLILTAVPEAATGAAARYRLIYEGRGDITLEGAVAQVSPAAGQSVGEISFTYVPGGAVLLTLRAIDPADPIRNIQVVREDHIALHAAGAFFNPDWLARIEGVNALRFMDWMRTNNSVQTAWEGRPQLDHYTWTRQGVPLEVMLALSAELSADPWFTLPHLADDAYIAAFAQVVRDTLPPGRRVYVELSNEVWNWQFEQARWADAGAQARWGAENQWLQFYTARAIEMVRIWSDVFGPDGAERLVRVISSQTGWLGLEEQVFDAPLWRAEAGNVGQDPADFFDAYAMTGYFGNALGSSDKAPMVRRWLAESLARAEHSAASLTGQTRTDYIAAHRYDHAVSLATQELRDGSVSGAGEDSLANLLGNVLPYQAEVAARHGLDLIMYEGGSHVVPMWDVADDTAIVDFFIHLNYTQEMGELYRTLLSGWYALGGNLFNAFSDVDTPTRYGSWGALRHLDDQNPRWDALVSFAPPGGD